MKGLHEHSPAARTRALSRSSMKASQSTSVPTVLDQWHNARPELDLGRLGLFASLAHAYWLTTPAIERLMSGHKINRGLFDVLTTLRRSGSPYTLAPKQLAQSLLLSGAGLTNRLDRLERQNLIRRLPEPLDRRGLKIQLTTVGRRLVDRILPELIKLERDLSAGLSERKSRELMRLLDDLALSLISKPNTIR